MIQNFDRNVFINCPFDETYLPLFNAIVFAVKDIGFNPRSALEASNASEFRLDKIMNLILECKYSIHDLSRIEADATSGLPRFNMPLELGLDLGCRRYGKKLQRDKVSLILDTEEHRYEAFISDIKGQDIKAHFSKEQTVIEVIRDWLSNELDRKVALIPSGDNIFQRYQSFQRELPEICKKVRWNPNKLPYPDFSYAVASWIEENPIRPLSD
jgi:hypothetical protein